MSDYVNIEGTLQDPVNISDTQFPNIVIKITSSEFGYNNQLPITRTIKLVDSGNYSFQLLKGTNYTINIASHPQSGSTGLRNDVTFNLEIPNIVDDTVTYDLFSFNVTNFTPLLQTNEISYTKFLMDSNPYYLMLENDNLIIKDTTETRQISIKYLFPEGGLLNNSSFEYDLVDEDYTFREIDLDGTASVTTDYNGDIPVISTDSIRSLDVDVTDSGSAIDDIILQQKLQPRSIIPNQYYLLSGYFKLVSGSPLSDIEINVENTNGEIISFDNITLEDDNNGWVSYSSLASSTTNIFLLNSSQELYFKIKFGGIGVVRLRIDELNLYEYYN